MRRGLVLALALAVAVLPRPAAAYFEDVAAGARGVSMGPASIALVTDASAYYWNPAGLADLPVPEVLVDYAKPYGIESLNSGALGFAGRAFGTGWAVAWHRLAITDVYSEDQFCLAAGRHLIEGVGGHVLSGGATFKFGRVAFQPFADPLTGAPLDFGAQSKGSFDVGLRWRTPWGLDFASVVRDVIEPRYELVAGSGGNLQKARLELGSAIHWNPESTITLGWSQIDNGPATLNAGIEILFFDVFAIRSGISNIGKVLDAYGSPNELQFNGGFGVYHHGYFVDAAAVTNHDLGASYRVSLRVPVFGRPK